MNEYYFFGSYALVAKVFAVTFPKSTIEDSDWTSGSGTNNLNKLLLTIELLGSTDSSGVS
jgi:hypothetical protein